MANPMLGKWEPLAWGLSEYAGRVPVPFHVLVGEAVDVARFFNTYYATQPAVPGKATRPGLEQAVTGGQFRPELGQEILELQEATQAAQTQYLLTVTAPDSPAERAEFVLSELVAGLEYLFDDGVRDDDDQRLERLGSVHANPTSQDALATALDDYAGLADLHRDRLTQLGAFEVALIDEARALAVAMREVSAKKLAGASTDAQKQALELRNRLASMLHDRMQLVRSAARYVFRRDPETVRRVTSAYQRQRVARYRKNRETVDDTEATETPAVNPPAATAPGAPAVPPGEVAP
jgi:hypothetical protein